MHSGRELHDQTSAARLESKLSHGRIKRGKRISRGRVRCTRLDFAAEN